MENTKLFTVEGVEDLRKFGDTEFYLRHNVAAERYRVLDGTYDAYNAVLTSPDKADIQEIFNAFYIGYAYGLNQGEDNGRIELQREMRLLLNL